MYNAEKFRMDMEQLKQRFEDDFDFVETCDSASDAVDDLLQLIEDRENCFDDEIEHQINEQIDSVKTVLLEFIRLCAAMMNNGPREAVA